MYYFQIVGYFIYNSKDNLSFVVYYCSFPPTVTEMLSCRLCVHNLPIYAHTDTYTLTHYIHIQKNTSKYNRKDGIQINQYFTHQWNIFSDKMLKDNYSFLRDMHYYDDYCHFTPYVPGVF